MCHVLRGALGCAVCDKRSRHVVCDKRSSAVCDKRSRHAVCDKRSRHALYGLLSRVAWGTWLGAQTRGGLAPMCPGSDDETCNVGKDRGRGGSNSTSKGETLGHHGLHGLPWHHSVSCHVALCMLRPCNLTNSSLPGDACAAQAEAVARVARKAEEAAALAAEQVWGSI